MNHFAAQGGESDEDAGHPHNRHRPFAEIRQRRRPADLASTSPSPHRRPPQSQLSSNRSHAEYTHAQSGKSNLVGSWDAYIVRLGSSSSRQPRARFRLGGTSPRPANIQANHAPHVPLKRRIRAVEPAPPAMRLGRRLTRRARRCLCKHKHGTRAIVSTPTSAPASLTHKKLAVNLSKSARYERAGCIEESQCSAPPQRISYSHNMTSGDRPKYSTPHRPTRRPRRIHHRG